MVVLDGIKEGIGKKIRGKIIAPATYGMGHYGDGHYGAGANTHGIYRVRRRWGKFVQEKMDFYFPTDPKTEAQLAHRQIFINGTTAWQTLTPTQKEEYNKKAKHENYYGYNIFMREYLLSH